MPKNKSFTVAVVPTPTHDDVEVNGTVIGRIERHERGLTGICGRDVVASQAKDPQQVLEAILAAYNLYA